MSFLFEWMDGWLYTASEVKPSFIQNPPHLGGLGLPSGLPFKPHTTVISSPNHPERDVFVFSFRFELFAEGLCAE